MMQKKYKIKNLDCASCAQKVEDALNKKENIESCQVVFATESLIIDSKNEIDIHELEKAIQAVEPDAFLQGHQHCHDGHCHHHDDARQMSGNQVVSYQIEGLDCASCASKVEEAIQKMDCIDRAIVNFSTGTLQVVPIHIDGDHLQSQLQKTIDKVETGVKIHPKSQAVEKVSVFSIKKNMNLIVGVILYILGVLLSSQWFAFYLFVIAYICIGYEVIFKAIRNIGRGEVFDENFLMAIATIGAFVIGDYAEAVAVMLFYGIGEVFQSYAVNKTRHSISSLMDIKSEVAWVKTNQGLKEVRPEDVKVGDIVVVKVGDKIPLDGIVVKGSSSLDTSSLTGESLPRKVDTGEEVLAGVINLLEVLEIQVTTPYENSTVSKILELMENAASKKAPIERFITKFAKIYTPAVVGLAVLLAVVPMLIFKDAVFYDWLYRALTFLVVSCPCALVISIPLGLYAGLGKASRIGALIKGGNYLELLKDIDTVVFDKTGTLTKGRFDVVEVNGSKDLLKYGAYGEYYSHHPIARSIVENYHDVIDESQIEDFHEFAGKGISVKLFGQHVLLGNEAFLKEHGVVVEIPESIGTVVFVAIDFKFVGSIVVADQIKESSISGIKALKKAGIKNTVMLTGDHQEVAKRVANDIGIDVVYSELLPQDKVEKVEQLLQDHRVAFVGDGINDAPVLARADIGIAMGGVGSDAAIEAADIVLMQDNIMAICDAIDISHRTDSILKQNIIFILVIKIGVLLLTMLGLSNMWMGVFADVGVTLIAILNAMRILR